MDPPGSEPRAIGEAAGGLIAFDDTRRGVFSVERQEKSAQVTQRDLTGATILRSPPSTSPTAGLTPRFPTTPQRTWLPCCMRLRRGRSCSCGTPTRRAAAMCPCQRASFPRWGRSHTSRATPRWSWWSLAAPTARGPGSEDVGVVIRREHAGGLFPVPECPAVDLAARVSRALAQRHVAYGLRVRRLSGPAPVDDGPHGWRSTSRVSVYGPSRAARRQQGRAVFPPTGPASGSHPPVSGPTTRGCMGRLGLEQRNLLGRSRRSSLGRRTG